MSELVSILTRHGAQTAVALSVILVAGALAVVCSRSPLHRQRIAELTLAAALLAGALLLLPLPRPGAQWLRTDAPALAVGAHETHATDEVAATNLDRSGPPPLPVAVDHGDVVPVFAPTAPTTPISSPRHLDLAPEPAPRVVRWNDATVARWFLWGALLFAAHVAFSLTALRRTLRRASPAPDWVRRLAARLGPGAPDERILVHSGVGRPFCCGMRRGTIVLPATLVRPELEPRVAAVLLHERAHLAQRHPRARVLAALAAPLLYWHPLYWWLARELRHSAELLADDMAVARLGKRRYVEELLQLAEDSRRALVPRGSVPGALGSRREFIERMESLLMRRSALATKSTGTHVVTRSAFACLLLGSVSIAWGRAPQDTAPPGAGGGTGAGVHGAGPIADDFRVPSDEPRGTLQIAFEIQDARGLGEFLIACDDAQMSIEQLVIGDGRGTIGKRKARMTLSGTNVDRIARVANSVTNVEFVSARPVSESPAGPSASADGLRAAALQAELAKLGTQISDLSTRYDALRASLGADLRGMSGSTTGLGHVGGSTGAGAGAGRSSSASGALEGLDRLGYSGTEGSAGSGGATAGSTKREVHGLILRVHDNSHVVSINRGTNHGVAVGRSFGVYRGSTYKGEVRVLEVRDEFCLGVIEQTASGRAIMEGDSASTSLALGAGSGAR